MSDSGRQEATALRPECCPASGSRTICVTESENAQASPQEPDQVTLKLRKPSTDKKVSWEANTVDNEHLNRKKSKCCCIYQKPRDIDQSSSESEDECENCFTKGHPEAKKRKRKPGQGDGSDGDKKCDAHGDSHGDNESAENVHPEPPHS